MRFGYARVSTKEQLTDRQIKDLEKVVDQILEDKASGKNTTDRMEWNRLNDKLRKGDTVVVHSLDRLSRKLEDIKFIYDDFQKRGIFIEVLDMPIISTYGKSELELQLIVPIVVQLLGYIAEKEREKILTRQAEGIAIAKAKGIHLGRPIIELTTKQKKAIKQWIDGAITGVQCMELTGLKKTKIYELRKELKEKGTL